MRSATETPSRRAVLAGLVGTFAAAGVPGSPAAGGRLAVIGWLSARESAVQLGARLATKGLVQRNAADLEDQLTQDLKVLAVEVDKGDPDSLRSGIDTLIRRDFAAGNMVILDGWALSKTEAKLYTLAWAEEQASL